MRATMMYEAGDVRVENVPDAAIVQTTDAIVRVTRACICGSDLWPYRLMERTDAGQSMGHEAIGVVEAVGSEVRKLKPGDFVIMPFAFSDGQCEFCHEGLQTACVHGGFFGNAGVNGAQAEALRIPQADGTLYALPTKADDALMPALLSLSDVMGTGHHAARVARVGPGKSAAVIGDGAVGLCAVIAAKRLGAERIILVGRHPDRVALGREFGATDVVTERGPEGIERIMQLTAGRGVHSVLESRIPLRSRARAAPSAASAFLITPASPGSPPSTRTWSLAVARHLSAPTSTNCSRMCSKDGSSPAECSTVSSRSKTPRLAMSRWTSASRSRC
jgi:threonine dehydrogenase-like Zn-dependent dehydrogenase